MPKKPVLTLFTDAGYAAHHKVGTWAAWAKYRESDGTMRHSGVLKGAIRDSGLAEFKALANGLHKVIVFFAPPPKTLIICQTDCLELVQQLLALEQPTTKEGERRLVLNYLKSLSEKHQLYLRPRHVGGHQGHRTPRHAVNSWCDSECTRHLDYALADLNATA